MSSGQAGIFTLTPRVDVLWGKLSYQELLQQLEESGMVKSEVTFPGITGPSKENLQVPSWYLMICWAGARLCPAHLYPSQSQASPGEYHSEAAPCTPHHPQSL